MRDLEYAKGFWNPYVAGIALGLVLLLTFYLMGTGLGASGAVARTAAVIAHAAAPTTVEHNPYYKAFYKPGGKNPLVSWMVLEVAGVFIGGLIAVVTARRFRPGVGRGPTASVGLRLGLAFGGGAIGGIGTRFAMGCTSGQALSGGATMAIGSWVFMMTVFATAFVAAYFVRREWS
ncbi:MAG: YeeE/YedE thiosulfate transporter family protein [Desulfomonilaceae bacterium]